MTNFEFNLKTKTKFGAGEALKLHEYIRELGVNRIGVIVDKNIAHLSYITQVLEPVKNKVEHIRIWEYDLGREPDYDTLDAIKVRFLNAEGKPTVDCFVGIGGGSVLDFAKGLATVVVNPGKAIQYRGFPTHINQPLPTIALPTTAGTASEVTYNAVFISREDKKKLGINTMHNFPALAVLDPQLTVSAPKSVTVASGMDALVHTIESYGAIKAHHLTRLFSKEAFRHLFNALPSVVENPKNLECRSHMLYGAYLAGIALMNAGSGPAGALSYPLGVHFSVPHGMAGALFLPHIISHNVKKGYDYSELYDLVENADISLTTDAKNKRFVEHFFTLTKTIGVPSTLQAFNVTSENIHILLNEAKNLEKAFTQNPVPFTVQDGQALLKFLCQATNS